MRRIRIYSDCPLWNHPYCHLTNTDPHNAKFPCPLWNHRPNRSQIPLYITDILVFTQKLFYKICNKILYFRFANIKVYWFLACISSWFSKRYIQFWCERYKPLSGFVPPGHCTSDQTIHHQWQTVLHLALQHVWQVLSNSRPVHQKVLLPMNYTIHVPFFCPVKDDYFQMHEAFYSLCHNRLL